MASSKKSDETFYQITYRDQRDGHVVSIKARDIRDSSLGLGFVRISGFVFEPEGAALVNPIEEQLRHRFAKVKSLHLSIYSILAVEELGVENRGLSFKLDRSNLIALPNGGAPAPSKPPS